MNIASTPCPKHPDQTAVMTCARCGTFACTTCQSPADPQLCTDCGERYAATSFNVSGILHGAFQLFFRHPLALAAFAGAQVVFGLAMLPLSMEMGAGQPPGTGAVPDFGKLAPLLGITMIVSLVYTSVMYAIFVRFYGDSQEGNTRPLGEVVREGISRAPALFVLNLVLAVTLMIGFMLCLVPGIFLSVALVFSIPALVLEPAGPFAALSISWERSKGRRLNIFLVLLVGGAILFGVGMVGAIGQFTLGRLGTPGLVVSTIIQQGLSGLGSAFFLVLIVLGYLRLSGRWLPGGQGSAA